MAGPFSSLLQEEPQDRALNSAPSQGPFSALLSSEPTQQEPIQQQPVVQSPIVNYDPIAIEQGKKSLDPKLDSEDEKPIRAWINQQPILRTMARIGLETARDTTRFGEELGLINKGTAAQIPQPTKDIGLGEELVTGVGKFVLPFTAALKGLNALRLPTTKLGYFVQGEAAAAIATPFAVDIDQGNLLQAAKDHAEELKGIPVLEDIANSTLAQYLGTSKEEDYFTKLGKNIAEGVAVSGLLAGTLNAAIKGFKAVKGDPVASYKATAQATGATPEEADALYKMTVSSNARLVDGIEGASEEMAKWSLTRRFINYVADQFNRAQDLEGMALKIQKEKKVDLGAVDAAEKSQLDLYQTARMTATISSKIHDWVATKINPIFAKNIEEGSVQPLLDYLHIAKMKQLYDRHIDSPYYSWHKNGELEFPMNMGVLTDNEFQKILDYGGRNVNFQSVREQLHNANKDLLEYVKGRGMIDDTMIERLLYETLPDGTKVQRDYILPTYRLKTDELNLSPLTGIRRTGKGSPLGKRLKGNADDLNFMNPLEALVKNISGIIETTEKNFVKLKMYNMIDRMTEELPESGLIWAKKIEGDELKTRAINVSVEQLQRALKKEGYNITPEWSQDDYAKIFFKEKMNIGGDYDFVMRNGKLEVYEVRDKGLKNLIQGMGPHQSSFVSNLPIIGTLAKKTKTLLTEMVTRSPGFALYSNLFRDSISAYNMSQAGLFKSLPLMNVAHGMYLRMKNDPTYKEGLKYIKFSTIAKGEGGLAKQEAKAIYRQLGYQDDQIIDNVKTAWRAYGHFLEHFEYASRVHEYDRLIKEGYSPEKAGFHAREVATDFSLRGASPFIKDLAQIIPFFNAGIQGSYKLARHLIESGPKHWLKFMTTIIAPSAMLWMYNSQDPSYWEQPDYVRDNNWLISTNTLSKMINETVGKELMPYNPEAKWLLFPKPYELGLLGTIFGERAFEAIEKQDSIIAAQAAVTWVASMARFNPLQPTTLAPQVFKPFLELAQNEAYGGREIVPSSMVGAAETKYQPWTSNTAIALSRAYSAGLQSTGFAPSSGLSPLAIEHLINSYLGTVGQTIDEFILSPIVGMASGIPSRPEHRLTERPFLERMFAPETPRSSSFTNKVFTLNKKTEEIEKDLAPLIGESKANLFKTLSELDLDRYKKMLENKDVKEMLAIRPVLKDSVEQIVEVNQAIKNIWYSNSDPKTKSETIVNMYKASNALSKSVVDALYGADLPTTKALLNRQKGAAENLVDKPSILKIPDAISEPASQKVKELKGLLSAQ